MSETPKTTPTETPKTTPKPAETPKRDWASKAAAAKERASKAPARSATAMQLAVEKHMLRAGLELTPVSVGELQFAMSEKNDKDLRKALRIVQGAHATRGSLVWCTAVSMTVDSQGRPIPAGRGARGYAIVSAADAATIPSEIVASIRDSASDYMYGTDRKEGTRSSIR